MALLAPRVEALESAYRRHMRSEEDQVLATAEQVLSSDALAAIGEEMAARRQLV